MSEEKEKPDLRVEDRRHFDREGNPIRSEESSDPQFTSSRSDAKPGPGSEERPKIDFASLVFLYVQTALIHLGELEDPVEKKISQNLEAARQMIDIVELLREKTKGNLTPQEDQYTEKVLFDLRMLYVQRARKSS
jgi:hypothetical protein